MYWRFLRVLFCYAFVLSVYAWADVGNSCVSMREFKAPNVEITNVAEIPVGTTEEKPWGQGRTAALPGYCRVEGVMKSSNWSWRRRIWHYIRPGNA
jgi:hypothetical protein